MRIINERLCIKRGSDASPIFKMRGKYYDNPMDLTGTFNITIELDKANRSKAIYDMTPLPAKKAYVEINAIRIEADNAGAIGNSIVLVFDGVKTLEQVVNDWNIANPSNTANHDGIGDEIITGTKRLWGGLDSYSPVQIDGNPILGRIKLVLTEVDTKALKRGDNQSIKITVDFGVPPSGTRKIAIFADKLDVVDR
jgi:hypothetical protein